MVEIAAELRFNQPSLGDCKRGKIHDMRRDPAGKVMFLPTWWGHLMEFASQVLGRHNSASKAISWDPVVIGNTQEFKRFYAEGRFTLHAAFLPGDIVFIHAVLPTVLVLADFTELLEVAGRYRGISPYRKDKRYRFGTFDVLDVQQVIRNRQ